MYEFKRIMVGLDFTLIDQTLIKYTSFLARLLNPERIYFVNIQRDLEVPEELRKEYPQFSLPSDEQLVLKMKEEVTENFEGLEDFETDFTVIEGSPQTEILRWTHIKNIDLLVMGRKEELSGSGIIPQQIARKVSCSVLLIPEQAPSRLKDILIATDFSDYSKLAMEEALMLGAKDENITIHIQNIYSIPSRYYKTGRTEAEFAQIMKAHAIEHYNRFLEEVNIGEAHVSPIFTLDLKRRSPALLINEVAHKRNADMIVIGARGRTMMTALFLGSVAEKLISIECDIPILLVKNKEKSFNFFEMLKAPA